MFLNFIKLSQSDGLSSPNVRKILQDRFGFMWIATQDGLNRYDGKKFVQFNSSELTKRNKTMGNDFKDFLFDNAHNCIWSITANGALNKINMVTCEVDKILLLRDSISQKISLSYKSLFLWNNDLYVSTYQGYIFQFNTSADTLIKAININSLTQKKSFIDKIFIDDKKQLWLFLENDGILILDSSIKKIIKEIPGNSIAKGASSAITFRDILIYKNDELIVATTLGVYSFNIRTQTLNNKFFSTKELPLELNRTDVLALSLTNEDLYISRSNDLFRINILTGKYNRILNAGNYNDRDWFLNIYTIFSEGNRLWLGNQQGVSLINNINSPFTPYKSSYTRNNYSLNHCYHLYPKNDSLIFSCTSDGLYLINTYNSSIDCIDNSQPYYQVSKTKNGDFLASGEKKLFIIRRNKLIPAKSIYPELDIISGDFIIASLIYKDSLLFLASQNNRGLYIWDLTSKKITVINDSTKKLALKDLRINNLLIDSTDKVWIICNGFISIYDLINQKIEHHQIIDPETNKPMDILMDACTDEKRTFVAVYGRGIVEIDHNFKSKRIVSPKNGLSNTGLYKIYFSNDSSLFSSSNDGLFFYDFSMNKLKKITVEDGLHSNSFDETSGARWKRKIFLGGLNGFTKIDLEKIKPNVEIPRLYFSHINILNSQLSIDTFNLHIKKILIPNNYTQVNINFSCINFSNSKKSAFYYKIKELQKDWINNKSETYVSLIGVSPGTYTLQVQAFNEDQIPSEIKELTLIFLPKWYQTLGFKILLLLAIAAIFYGLYRFRINHLKKEEKIRNQVAGDLHDELGSTLNSVKIFTSLALMEKDNKSHLEKIKEATQYAIASVKDIIWVLDDKRDTLDHLLSRISQFAKPLCEASGISYKQHADENLETYKLGKEEKRNLYMIIKESINNSSKYSECSLIELLIKNKGGKLNISISDNGKGFDRNEIGSGYGLKNILRRSAEIGYQAEINSSPGNGTLIYLEKK